MIELKLYEERFLAKVNKTAGCWLWTGAKTGSGYGQMQTGKIRQQAHRIAYQLYIGQIPEPLVLDHICCRRICVNPYHVRPMTLAENSRLGSPYTARKACHKGHLYTPENTRLFRGYRVCRTCKREKDRKDRREHLEHHRERGRLGYAANKENVLARQRARYQRVREKVLAQQKLYRKSKGEGRRVAGEKP